MPIKNPYDTGDSSKEILFTGLHEKEIAQIIV